MSWDTAWWSDLFLAFGKAHLNTQIHVEVERTGANTGTVTTATITGSQTDLYDWDYDIGFPDYLCAILEAVFGVHFPPTGGVYRNKVLFSTNPVTTVEGQYEFNP